MRRIANELETVPSNAALLVERVPVEHAEALSRSAPFVFGGHPNANVSPATPLRTLEAAGADEGRREHCQPLFAAAEFAAIVEQARFFVARFASMEALFLSRQQGDWGTTKVIEARVGEAVKSGVPVILFATVSKLSSFQGAAYVLALGSGRASSLWRAANPFGGSFKLHWLSQSAVAFTRATAIRNALCDGQPVFLTRDGHEVDGKAGATLLAAFEVPFKDGQSAGGAAKSARPTAAERADYEREARPVFDLLYERVPDFAASIRKLDASKRKSLANRIAAIVAAKHVSESEEANRSIAARRSTRRIRKRRR